MATTSNGFYYPASTDAPDGAGQMFSLAKSIDDWVVARSANGSSGGLSYGPASAGPLGTGRESQITREGRVAALTFMLLSPGGLAADQVVMTLAAGYRPAREQFFTAGVYKGNGSSEAFTGFAVFRISTNGAIDFKYSPSGSGAGSQYLASVPIPL